MSSDRRGMSVVYFVGCVVFALLLLGALAGCERTQTQPKQDTPKFALPDGFDPEKPVEMRYIEDGGDRKSTERASGTGAGLATSSDEAAAKFATTAPGVSLPGITGTGGDGSTELTLHTLKGAASNPLLWVGILGVIAAGVAVYFGLRRAAMICGLTGAAFIVASMMPGWAWFIIGGVGAIAGGVYLWAEYHGKATHEAARAMAAGISDLKKTNSAVYETAKAAVAGHADSRDRRVIASIKDKDRL